jgi:hypothetical protein
MTPRLLILLVLFAGALSVSAALPVDAGARQKELYSFRQRKLAEYDRDKQQREQTMVVRDRQVRQEMAAPPWNISAADSSVIAKTGIIRPGPRQNGASPQGRNWILSIMALVLIGGCVWWVRIATEKEEDR